MSQNIEDNTKEEVPEGEECVIYNSNDTEVPVEQESTLSEQSTLVSNLKENPQAKNLTQPVTNTIPSGSRGWGGMIKVGDNHIFGQANVIARVFLILGIIFLLPFPFFCFGSIFIFIALFVMKKSEVHFNDATKTVTVYKMGAVFKSIGRKMALECKYNEVKDFIVVLNPLVKLNGTPPGNIRMVLKNGNIVTIGTLVFYQAQTVAQSLKQFMIARSNL